MIDENRALHGYIQGRVQGVCFRAETRQQAWRLGLTGWVRNMPDGRVEVLLCGPLAALEAMQKWLQQGPPGARVDSVTLAETEIEETAGFGDFEIRR